MIDKFCTQCNHEEGLECWVDRHIVRQDDRGDYCEHFMRKSMFTKREILAIGTFILMVVLIFAWLFGQQISLQNRLSESAYNDGYMASKAEIFSQAYTRGFIDGLAGQKWRFTPPPNKRKGKLDI
jgi:hypothetical protein